MPGWSWRRWWGYPLLYILPLLVTSMPMASLTTAIRLWFWPLRLGASRLPPIRAACKHLITVTVVLSSLAVLAPCLPAAPSTCATLLMVPPTLYALLVMEVLGGRHWRGSREIRSS